MRSKHSSRTRTRTHSREQRLPQGAWANRYDYLNTSPTPPSGPPPPHHHSSSSPVPSVSSSPSIGVSSEQQARALSLELFGANAKATEKRDWADDDVPSTLFSPGRFPLVLDVATGSTPGRKEIMKQPHDASVFVGSLPPHKDEAELAQLLAQHLSRYAKVQNIKIVRDSKGGLCAFVQCENATQAAQLVTQAQASQQSFLGRYLRYESARARRTLWISYRTPMYFMACSSQDEEGPDIVTDENGVKGRWIESDLPDAMRIWKPRDVRYPIVTFRGEARNIGDASRFDKDTLAPNVPAAFQQKGVLFTDLKFDELTVRRMAEAFGPLESFRALTSNEIGEDPYPLGHDANRTANMDTGIWEIKWEHRDDCITALNTLRRIPHLTVTWAKDAGQLQTPRTGFLRTPTSPRHPYSHPHREVVSPIVRGRPFLLLDRNSSRENAFRSADLSSSSQTSAQSSKLASPQKGPVRLGASLTRRGNEAMHSAPEGEETDDGWTFVGPHNGSRTVLPASSERTQGATEDTKGKVREWSEGDFPPLRTGVCSSEVKKCDEESVPKDAVISLSDPAPQFPESDQSEASIHEEANPGQEGLINARTHSAHRRSLSNPAARLQVDIPQTSPNTQGLEIPPTPDLAASSLTQTPTSGQPELESPAHPALIPLPPAERNVEQKKFQEESQEGEGLPSESEQGSVAGSGFGRRDHRRQVTVDPKAIFVGGLESYGPRPWDEARLREIFGKYGEVREVHIVCPTKKAGFAFVSFTDEESAAKAISGEHNRFYDGRQIRVQIRDIFPSRGGFKFRGRGFGRRPFGFVPHFDGMERHANTFRPSEPNSMPTFNQHKPFGHHLVYTSGPQERAPLQANTHGPHGSHPLVPSASIETDTSTLRSLNSFDSKIDPEAFQETDSKTAVSNTPPPPASNLTSSTSGSIAPIIPGGLGAAPVNYYSPHTWTSPCGVQMHYPMTYGAYGGLIPPIPMPFAPTGQTSDPSSVTGTTPVQWNPMYRPGMPFVPYPYFVVPPAAPEIPRSAATTSSQPTTPVKGQPPLHATGFIQGEHGVLFPVYPQEALSEYMSGCSPTQSTSAPRASTASTSAPFVGQQPNIATTHMWHGYTQAPQFIAYPIPPVSSVGVTTATTPPGLGQPHAAQQQIQSQPLQVATSHLGAYTTSTVGSTGHAFPVQQTIVTPRSSISSAHGMPPPYFVGPQPSSISIPSTGHRSGTHAAHTTHGTPPERNNTYVNKQPPRRDPSFHGRNGQHGTGRGAESTITHSPSMTRSTSGYSSTSRADYSQNNNSFHQRQHSSSTAPPPQLGFNRHTQDGGHSQQQHQWMANMQQ